MTAPDLADSAVVDFVHSVLLLAVKREAMSIHFHHDPEQPAVRLEVGEDDFEDLSFPPCSFYERVVVHVRLMFCLDVAKARKGAEGECWIRFARNRRHQVAHFTVDDPDPDAERTVIRLADVRDWTFA